MSDFNTQVIEEFRANGGKVGGMFEGAPMVLVHSVGAKSGHSLVTPLVYFGFEGRNYIVASAAGAPKNPAWYHNLKANPDTSVEIGTETHDITAVELTPEEREPIWKEVVAANPGFGEYQEKSEGRVIPVLRLEPRKI